jgi:hypothetical protein
MKATESNIIYFPQIGQGIAPPTSEDKQRFDPQEELPVRKLQVQKRMIQFPLASDARPVIFNNNKDEYAKSFGVREGDTIWTDHPTTTKHGDLILTLHEGLHYFATFNDDEYMPKSSNCGVVLGVFRSYEREA